MLWISAFWIVAAMANKQPIWNWAVNNLPHESVDVDASDVLIALRAYGKLTVPVVRLVGSPTPAFIIAILDDVRPESFKIRGRQVRRAVPWNGNSARSFVGQIPTCRNPIKNPRTLNVGSVDVIHIINEMNGGSDAIGNEFPNPPIARGVVVNSR